MVTETEYKPEALIVKWDEFFKESRQAKNGDLAELVGDIITLRHLSLMGGIAELLASKYYITLGFSDKFQTASIEVQKKLSDQGQGSDLPREIFRISWKESLKDSSIFYYNSSHEKGESIILDNQVLKHTTPGSLRIRLSLDQVSTLSRKLWNTYRVTERWIEMDHFFGG